MQNFLEVYADPKSIRALLESVHPIAFAQIKGKLWTTTGEIKKFSGPGSAQRIKKEMLDFAGPRCAISDPEDARYFATQLGKPAGSFGAAMSMWGHVHALSPEIALCAILSNNKSKASDQLLHLLGFPRGLRGSQVIDQIKQAIETGKPHLSWRYTRGESQLAAPPESPKSPIVAGELSGLLQVCFAEEAKAKDQYDKAVAALESAKSALDEAIENTKAIVRATKIAERLAK
jgi:hypothetical protein